MGQQRLYYHNWHTGALAQGAQAVTGAAPRRPWPLGLCSQYARQLESIFLNSALGTPLDLVSPPAGRPPAWQLGAVFAA